MAPVKRENRRQIPLTSFTLLTIPEETMLDVYLRTRQTIDISVEKTMSQPDKSLGSSPSLNSDERAPKRRRVDRCSSGSEDVVGTTGLPQTELELELQKFMAAITATESPDAVIKTIAASKSAALPPH